MTFLTRLGDTLLSKLAPETEAWAADDPCLGVCPTGACQTSYVQLGACVATRRQKRCCRVGGSACPAVTCGAWRSCGVLSC